MTDRTLYLTNEQYVALLERQRARIEDSVALEAEDSTTHGDKYTRCTWGLCSDELEVWPEDTWLFPPFVARSPNEQSTARPKYLGDQQFCPFDRKDNRQAEFGSGGCFYRCRIFTPKGEPKPDRQQALDLYQIRLKQAEGLEG